MKTFVALFALIAVAASARLTHVKPIAHQVSHHIAGVVPVARAAVAAAPRAAAAPAGSDVVVLKESLHNNDGLSGYQYAYELSDGSARDENAQVEVRGPEDAVLRVTGSFRFVALDGQTYTISYVADENGFQPQGAHLPVPPTLH